MDTRDYVVENGGRWFSGRSEGCNRGTASTAVCGKPQAGWTRRIWNNHLQPECITCAIYFGLFRFCFHDLVEPFSVRTTRRRDKKWWLELGCGTGKKLRTRDKGWNEKGEAEGRLCFRERTPISCVPLFSSWNSPVSFADAFVLRFRSRSLFRLQSVFPPFFANPPFLSRLLVEPPTLCCTGVFQPTVYWFLTRE